MKETFQIRGISIDEIKTILNEYVNYYGGTDKEKEEIRTLISKLNEL